MKAWDNFSLTLCYNIITVHTLQPWTLWLYFHFICTLFVLYFHLFCSYFYIFTELTNHVREPKQWHRHFFAYFPMLFLKWRCDFTQQPRHFFKFFRVFINHGQSASYNSETFYQWNYNRGFWRKYYYFFRSKTRNKWNTSTVFTYWQHSCFPTMGAINSLCARDQEISCQSWCYKLPQTLRALIKTRKKGDKTSVRLFWFTNVIG